jgi:hypothetical protein
MLGSSVANLKPADREFLNNLASARTHYTNWQKMLGGAVKEGVTSFYPNADDAAAAAQTQAGAVASGQPAAPAAAPAARVAAAVPAQKRVPVYDMTSGRQIGWQ